MNIWMFFEIFKELNKKLRKTMSKNYPKITKLKLLRNPRGSEWGKRSIDLIKKIIVHQSLADWTTQRTHEYHISPESHLKPGTGAPAIAYHYTIEKDGTIYQVNNLNEITWHCAGENIQSIGIVVLGDFAWKENVNGKAPSKEQLKSLRFLLKFLTEKLKISKTEIYGHQDFGKESCPGFVLYDFIQDYKKDKFRVT